MSKQYTVGLRFTADATAVSSAITTMESGLQKLRSQTGTTGQSVLGLGQALDTSGQQAQRFGAHAETAGGGADRLASALGRVAHYGLAGVGLHAVAQAAFSAGQALFQASARAQSLATQLNFATDGRSAQELAFVGSVADRLGLQLSSTAQAYAGFAAAARGTALEGAPVRTVFESIAKASAVMGLSAEQSSGALLAVQQMMGKGVVSAEEFRGQLGERMPIALQAGAQALGVTTSEFSKLLETGQIVAQDFLPKFAAAIDKLLAGSVEEAANRLDASAQRMGNAWEKLKKTVGDSGVSQAIGTGMTAVSHDMNAFSEAMDRAKERGGGFLAQINQGLGVMIGRAVGLNYLSDAFRSNAERASHLASALPKAEAELAALQARGAATSENIYLRSSYFDALRYTEELRAAKRAQDALKGAAVGGGRGVVNPTTVGASLEQQQRDSEAANALRLKLSGVPDGYLKDMQEIIRLNQAGALTGKEYTEALAQQQAALLKKTDATHGAATGQKALQSSYESFLTGLNQKNAAQRQELDTGKKVSESDQLRIKFQELLGTSLKGLGEQQRRTIEQGLDELAVGEKLAQQAKQAAEVANARVDARRQESQGIAQWLADQEAAAQKGLADVRGRINALAMEEDAARLAASSNVSLAEAVELVAIARLQEAQAAKFHEGSEGWQAIEREIAARRELLGLVKGKEAREGFKKTAEDAEKELKRVTEQYEQGLTNAAMQGGKSLREYIEGMLRATAFRIILDPIMKPLAGVLASVTGGSSAASAAAGNGGITSLANTLSSAYSALTTGVSSSIATAFGKFATSSVGTSLGLSTPAVLGNNVSAYVAPQLTSAGSAIGTGLGMLGNGFAGYGISSAISNGYTTGGNTVNVLSGIASAFFGPIAGVVGGLINRAFGRKLKDTGIEGTLGGSAGFEGNSYQFYKGGWLRSDKTVTGELDSEVERQIAATFKATQVQVGLFATALGLQTDRIASFTTALKFSTNGLDEAGIQQAFQDALAKGSNELAQQVLGTWESTTTAVTRMVGTHDGSNAEGGSWTYTEVQDFVTTTRYAASEYARAGEEAIDTLSRLATSLTTVNGVLDSMGSTVMSVSLAGADMASSLVDLFGGLDAFTAANAKYYETYYSEAERLDDLTRMLTKSFAALGQQLPRSNEELRARIEAQDLTTESGRKMYASLVGLSAQLDQVTKSAAASRSALQGAITNVATSIAGMRESANRALAGTTAARTNISEAYAASQKKVADAQSTLNDLLEESADATRSFAGTLTDYLAGLRTGTQSGMDPITRKAMLAAELQSTAVLAQGGDAASRDRLTSVADAYLEAARTTARSDLEYAREVSRVRTAIQGVVASLPATNSAPATTPTTATLEQQIAEATEAVVAAQAEQARYAQLAAQTGTSLLESTDVVGDEIAKLRTAYEAAASEQASANIRLEVALAALDALGMSEAMLKALAAGQTGASPGDFAVALGVSDQVITQLQGALGLSDGAMQSLSQALNVSVGPQVYESLGKALGVPSDLTSTLSAVLGAPASVMESLAGSLGLSPVQLLQLQGSLGLNADTAVALQTALGVDPATRQAWATALGVDTSQLLPLATALGWDAAKAEQLGTAIGLAQATVDTVQAMRTLVGFSGDALATVNALSEQIGISPLARDIIDRLHASVGMNDAALATVAALSSAVGIGTAAEATIGTLGSAVGMSNAAQATIASLGSAVGMNEATATTIGTLGGAVGMGAAALGTIASLGGAVGMNQAALGTIGALGGAVGMSDAAQTTIGSLGGAVGLNGATLGTIASLGSAVGIGDATLDTIASFGTAVGISDATLGTLAGLGGAVGMSQAAIGTISGLGSAVGLGDAAQAIIANLGGAVGLNDATRNTIATLGTSVGIADEAQATIQALGSAVGVESQAQRTFAALGSAVGIDRAAQSTIGGLGGAMGIGAAAMGTIGGLGTAVGLQPDMLASLGKALGLSDTAMQAIAAMSPSTSIDATVRNAYASIGRVGVGSAVNQIDAQGLEFWKGELASGKLSMQQFLPTFLRSAADTVRENQGSELAVYLTPYLKQLKVPGFAVGTSYVPRDMIANIHAGEEITPRPYVDAQRFDRERANDLLAAIQAEVSRLREAVDRQTPHLEATRAATQDTEDLLNTVTRGGRAMQTEAFQ